MFSLHKGPCNNQGTFKSPTLGDDGRSCVECSMLLLHMRALSIWEIFKPCRRLACRDRCCYTFGYLSRQPPWILGLRIRLFLLTSRIPPITFDLFSFCFLFQSFLSAVMLRTSTPARSKDLAAAVLILNVL